LAAVAASAAVSRKGDRSVIVAAGAVVLRAGTDGVGVEVLVIHRPRYDDWSFPKGKLHGGETPLLAACREVVEETGVRIRVGAPLSDVHYEYEGLPKVVHYWQAEQRDQAADLVSTSEAFVPNDEVDEIAWLPLDEARARLTQDYDRGLLDDVGWPATTPMVLLRHAKAVKRAKWDGTDDDRPLDEAGLRQAEDLVAALDAYGIARVHTSDWTRCVQTVLPYARVHALPIVPEPGLTEEGFEEDPDAGVSRLRGLLAEADESHAATVLCSHRPVLPALITALFAGSEVSAPKDPLPPGGMLVAHLRDHRPVAVEVHRPFD
jgi:8-oxo-dGTP pyrophosphatase MutT (NUDIX family)/phosphohistidine phosphatase SixA